MTAEFWMYDGRLGRRWNVDPKLQKIDCKVLVLSARALKIEFIKRFSVQKNWQKRKNKRRLL